MLMGIVAVVPVVVAGILFAWVRRKQSHQAASCVFRCSACTQQIRFRPTQIGAKGHCPRCWKSVTLPVAPATDVAVPTGRRQSLRFGRLPASVYAAQPRI
jgi:uncharacterized paraquat-inducible protein A